MIAWLVAGQGAEHAGMGLELARAYAPAAALWERASAAADKDLRHLTEVGGRSLLRTEYLQPALTAAALGAAAFLLDEGIEPSLVLGHSAGEVGALAVAGHLSFADACSLSAKRGHRMALAARAHPGGMAGVRGSRARAHEVVAHARKVGAIFEAGQTTEETHLVTGNRAALRAAASLEGVSPLPVSGPWHSPLMEQVVSDLQPLAQSLIGDASGATAWVSGETPDHSPTDASQAAALLLSQLTRPMNLHDAIQRLLREGADEIVILGPHHTLRNILARHLEAHVHVRIHSTASLEELQTVVKELA